MMVLTSQLGASCVSGKLTVTPAVMPAGSSQRCLSRRHGGCRFRQAELYRRGDTLTASVPVTDSWGEAAPDLRGKTLSLVLADSGQAQEASSLSAQAAPAAGATRVGWCWLMALAGAYPQCNALRHLPDAGD